MFSQRPDKEYPCANKETVRIKNELSGCTMSVHRRNTFCQNKSIKLRTMKIGILTLPLHTNYGGILQAYALQTVLERMGHEVKVYNLDRKPVHHSAPRVLFSMLYRILSTIKNRYIFDYYNINKESKARYKEFCIKTQHTQIFVDKYIHSYYLHNYIKQVPQSDVDCVVVGSDQIWDRNNGSAISGDVANSYLSYLPDSCKRFSYAASFGHDEWRYTPEQTKVACKAIKQFSGVSVREASGIKLCKQNLAVEAQVNIDPTMLLTADDYVQKLGIDKVEPSSGNMLVYVIDRTSEKDAITDYVEKVLRLKHFRVNSKAEDTNAKNVSMEERIQPPVEKWLRGFYDAKFVVTDSFHACVFSILFHKPFIVIGNRSRGLTRFLNLLSKFQLDDRLVETLDNVKAIDLTASIQYQEIEHILENERKGSINYLTNNLSL